MNKNSHKKIGKLIYIIIFFGICSIPVLTMPFVNWSQESSGENRTKAELPELLEEGSLNWEYFEEMDDYLNDNFQFREALISINSTYKEEILLTSAEDQVIIGYNDWLYYEETIDDYSSLDVLSDEEINNIVKILSLVNEYTDSVGCDFVFTIAANKSSIYAENLPWNYQSLDIPNNADKLSSALREAGLDEIYADMFETMESSDIITYLARDSHWNNYGAYLGFQEMCFTLEIDTLNFEIISEEIRVDYEADLDGMLYASGEHYDEQIYYEYDSSYTFESNFKSVEDLQILTSCETGVGSIVVFRDSFGNALVDYFGLQFEEAQLRRVVPYDVDLAVDVDYMIIEIVERNIPNLLDSAPVMPAIERNAEDIETSVYLDLVTEIQEDDGDYIHVYGICDGSDVISYDSIFIELTTTDSELLYYEAFPIIEGDLELDTTENVIGYSAYLPLELMEDVTTLKIIYQ